MSEDVMSEERTYPEGFEVEVAPGLQWRVGVFNGSSHSTEIVIPSDALGDLSNEQIGSIVRSLVPHALLMQAIELAEYIFRMESQGESVRHLDTEHLERWIEIIRPHDGYRKKAITVSLALMELELKKRQLKIKEKQDWKEYEAQRKLQREERKRARLEAKAKKSTKVQTKQSPKP